MFELKIHDQLSLKMIEFQDAEPIYTLTEQNRMHLREWLPWVDYIKAESDTLNFIKNCLKGHADNSSLNTVILYRDDIVGMASFNQLNWSNRTASIGYWISEQAQGKGIMTDVSRTLTQYAFHHLNMNKVEIRAATENKKSQSIPIKLGFTKEGGVRQAEWLYDHYVDHVIYGMLASEWKSE
ncbi:GNAT family N-acetyltransferase [Alkalihalobacillus sp. LMS6]|uniref:GNAT family N-acetyltransferase n=1 Tax=Alkalihalobacillus sp. LMS6 TaxID=2924034 RepID=UPI0020D01D12|nr:GNAT family protein [Alkalihalobacillus sp. LMS6]UTR06949.1 GNAT family N-acetyltransferase [Alkalihalobacillus sp. LMS6]